jgi:2-polyprenyl-3-methyl-5-hydroxy-6-metoxy-1,4-benzoquinol methylase
MDAHIAIESPCPFKSDLVSYDSDLLRYPQRGIDFERAGSFLFNQDMGSVGTTLWDAEVVLSHALEADGVAGAVMELGCGSGLAAMVSARLDCTITVQELPEVLDYTREVFKGNTVSSSFIGAKWGSDFSAQVDALGLAHSFDYVVMADVLYHCTDFSDLISSIRACARPGTKIYICYEQRRKNLDSFFSTVSKYFSRTSADSYIITNSSSGVLTHINVIKYEAMK